jgi:hypothetical protein
LKTFTVLKDFVWNPCFKQQRLNELRALSNDMIDPPIIHIIHALNKMSCCFTLQSCYGHFVFRGQKNSHCCAPLPPAEPSEEILFRVAYIAFCLENSRSGKDLFSRLKQIPLMEPDYIQFGCANWFWQKQVNSYVLQVEPRRFKDRDKAVLSYQEALHVEKTRDDFFDRLATLFSKTETDCFIR